jgi:glycosyltransferase involved in cell wall biosynthesis
MKVLHYTQEFSPLTQTFIYEQIRATVAEGYEIKVCTRKRVNITDRPFDDISITGNMNFIRPNILRYLYAMHGIHKLTLGIGGWRHILEKFKPDLIHCHFGWSLIDILPVLQYYNNSLPVLVSLHGTDVTVYPDLVGPFKSLLRKHPYRIHYTTPSGFLKNEALKILSIPDSSISVLPNMVNNKFRNCTPAQFNKGDQLRIVNIGRLIPVKGHRYLLNAFALFVKRHYANSKLILVGKGGELANINKLIKEYALQDRVSIVPEMMHGDIPELLSGCHIYVQPSIHDNSTNQSESFGVSAVEAIVAGLPVIVTDSGGLKETVMSGHPDSAIVVREKNPEDICNALARILDNGVKQDAGFRKKITDAYDEKSHREKLAALYQSLVTR